jgi:RNA polymerase sigma factor (TIGR02999 family)
MSFEKDESLGSEAVGFSHRPMRRVSDGFGSLYPQLRVMAAALMRRERASHTLQPTAVVSEAFLRLAARDDAEHFASEAHLLAYAATTMRSVLVDHARRRSSKKRGRGAAADGNLLEFLSASTGSGVDLIEIDDALKALEAADARAARVVEARVFGGLTVEEVSEAMGLSLSSVSRDWRFGRAFLAEQLSDDGAPISTAEEDR